MSHDRAAPTRGVRSLMSKRQPPTISDTVRGEGGRSTAWSIEEYGIEKFIWVKCVSTPSVGRTEPDRTAQVALSLRKMSEVSKMRAKEEGASDHPFHDEADR